MSQQYIFEAEIKKVADINAAYVQVPFDVKEAFGKGRIMVRATFDGEEYNGQVVKMNTSCHIIGITKAIRDKIGKRPGDIINVSLEEREPNKPTFVTVDEYIDLFAGDVQDRLIKLRSLILSCSSFIIEKISWAMPTYVYHGNLVHFSAAKNHIGFYPSPSAIEAFADRLNGYNTSKGAVQFPNDRPMPYDIILEMILFRIKENNKNHR